ncbi:hypothetical protein KCP75_21205 [Salmonella enterica subsp. enterica]|nr:hypothetical protein KCP75_21205 [Salmonella enterica subsp. enterica]
MKRSKAALLALPAHTDGGDAAVKRFCCRVVRAEHPDAPPLCGGWRGRRTTSQQSAFSDGEPAER